MMWVRFMIYLLLVGLLCMTKAASAVIIESKTNDFLPLEGTVTLSDSARTVTQEEKSAKGDKQSAKGTSKNPVEIKKDIPKVVPKARNQQIPRPVVLPRIKGTGPPVKVKAKINTKIKIKL